MAHIPIQCTYSYKRMSRKHRDFVRDTEQMLTQLNALLLYCTITSVFDRASRPCAARTRLFRLIIVTSKRGCCAPHPAHRRSTASLLMIRNFRKKTSLKKTPRKCYRLTASPTVVQQGNCKWHCEI
jgi:hypothetical protein